MNITKRLLDMKDEEYSAFISKLTPNIDPNTIIGVRVPLLREFAKELLKQKDYDSFLKELPHKYYDENLLHSILISKAKDFNTALMQVEEFLPYINSWAVCDTLSPKVFKKQKDVLLNKIHIWSSSKETYTCRFGIDMLMNHFLDEDFKAEHLEMPAQIISKEYYINMMIAWFFATALAKQWDSTIPYISEHRLGKWVNNKTIQKACESNRITLEQKEYLKKFKIK